MRLYHFMKEEYALKALINKRLKISHIDKLNDPFELLGVIFPSERHEKAFNNVKMNTVKELGVICFSKEYDEPVQWSHYAEHHRGICLGFDVEDKLIDEGILCEVKYLKNRLQIPDYLLDPDCREASVKFMREIYTSKYDGWKYESEYRVFSRLEEKIGEFYFSDFGEDFALKEVILGCKSTLEKSELYRYMENLHGSVEIYDAKMCAVEYKILKSLVI